MSSNTKLMTDDAGLTFEYLDAEETAFLWEEIFTRRSYFQHGVRVSQSHAPVIVDAGANIGLFGMACLRENVSARVYALEPSPTAFQCLERNLAVNESALCMQVLLRDVAAAKHVLYCFPDAPGESTCHLAERRRQRARLKAHVGKAEEAGTDGDSVEPSVAVEVPATTLSDLLSTWNVTSVDLLKVDVEGDELLLLRGIRAADWPKIRQVVCEVHDVHGRLDSVCRLLRRHGLHVVHEQQRGGFVDGYEMIVPDSLRLFYVYATREASASVRGACGRTGGGTRKRALE